MVISALTNQFKQSSHRLAVCLGMPPLLSISYSQAVQAPVAIADAMGSNQAFSANQGLTLAAVSLVNRVLASVNPNGQIELRTLAGSQPVTILPDRTGVRGDRARLQPRWRAFGESAMKTLILVVTTSLATASAAANAAPANGCTQIVQNLNASASAITQNANSYWQHRANFVNRIFGQARPIAPEALTAAGQGKSQADALKAAMPNSLASFKNQVAVAEAQNCLSPTQLETIAEPTIKLAKRVNFDQFPPELPTQTSVDRGPPRMPMK